MPITTSDTLKGKTKKPCHQCGVPSPVMRIVGGMFICPACDPKADRALIFEVKAEPEPEPGA